MKRIMIILIFTCIPTLLVVGQAEMQKGKAILGISYFRENDQLPKLKISVKTKKGKRFEPIEGALVNLFFNEESAQAFLGRVKTNHKGEGSITIPDKFKEKFETASSPIFIATITGSKLFEDASSELEITRTKIELTLDEKDSIKTVHAKLLSMQDGNWLPAPDTEIKLTVKRMVNDIGAGEEEFYTTDENGEAHMLFNRLLPGNANGELAVAVKVEDNDLYGNVISSKIVKWGSPRIEDNSFARRTLWATRDKTPLWLLIFPNLVIISVWAVIFYLVYQIIVIYKLGKENRNI